MSQTASERRKNVKNVTCAVLAVFLAFTAGGAERHRPSRLPGWLVSRAYSDPEAISLLAGSATTIGLGDDTHGTHEFFETKLRMIQKLVRDEDFRTVAFEGPFADFNRLDDYVLGGSGDPRAILRRHELGYWMWASDEMIEVIEWIRAFNQAHSDRPPVEVVGFDVTDVQGAGGIVSSYLDSTDPATAANTRTAYAACIMAGPLRDCASRVAAIRDDLQSREPDLVTRSSQHAYDVALHAANIVAAGFDESPYPGYFAWRDENMAINAIRLKQRRSSNGRIILWAHQEHLGRTVTTEGSKSTGKFLTEQLGADYFVAGSCTGSGSFNVVKTPPYVTVVIEDFPPADSLSYEEIFQSAGMPLMLIPLRADVPAWLAAPHTLRGGTSGSAYEKMEVLPEKLDAILYVDRTTPASSFW